MPLNIAVLYESKLAFPFKHLLNVYFICWSLFVYDSHINKEKTKFMKAFKFWCVGDIA